MKTITVNLGKKQKYNIDIEKSSIVGNSLPKGFVITDTNVFKKYGDLINTDKVFIIRAGEQSKSGENYLEIARHIPEDTEKIIAFGGGVVGDLAGFVASTYMRSIPFIQVPTTLLAMVDSSIGGKNGVNLDERKNYLGTIYQPQAVLIDPLFLETLPNKEINNGLAEIIKYAAVFNIPSLQRLQKGIKHSDLENIIVQCCRIKARVVEKDEQDKGYRHTLNFGHTIGHSLELLFGLKHGEAISIGMAYEAKLGNRCHIVSIEKMNTILEIIKANSLPTELPFGANTERIIELMKADKKGKFIFAFDEKSYNVQVEESCIREVLNS